MSFRKPRTGRQSELLYNEELRIVFESIRRMLEDRGWDNEAPKGKLDGELWLDKPKKDMYAFNEDESRWDLLFNDRFRMTGEILSETPPSDPVKGQIWMNQGMLWVYTINGWVPIKAFDPDSSDIYFSSFEDFLLLSPLSKEGSTVYDDNTKNIQYLTPSLKVGRFFVDGEFEDDYNELSQVAFQYPEIKMIDRRPSWVHVNPGRLTNIKKRFVKVFKDLSSIDIPSHNTEYYGFVKNSPYANLLTPKDETDMLGDYYVQPHGIMLGDEALYKYDYILAITYDFSWIKESGRLTKSSSKDQPNRYYIGGVKNVLNVFIDGYDLEDTYYNHSPSSKSIDIDGDIYENTNISVWKNMRNEYGIIERITYAGEGVIRMRKTFKSPLVFVNGEALHPVLDELPIDDDGVILVSQAERGMTYSIVETEYKDGNIVNRVGLIEDKDDDEVFYIDGGDILGKIENGGVILFVDGMLIKKEDVEVDHENNRIYVDGMLEGQVYIMLEDKNHDLIPEEVMKKAVSTGKIDESLVYVNGKLINNETSILAFESEDQITDRVYGEIKLFIDPSSEDKASNDGQLRMWDGYDEEWVTCPSEVVDHVNNLCFSYTNGSNAALISLDLDESDVVDVFSYNMAQTIENPLRIDTFPWSENDGLNVKIKDRYIPGTNSLQVYFDGVRQLGDNDHPNLPGVIEWKDGDGFTIPALFTGRITYVIESPEEEKTQSSVREVLTRENVLSTPNVYKTTKPLYPGRVVAYTNGMRQPRESFAILDNYTIMFKDKAKKLIGHKSNYPIEYLKSHDNEDKIVEVERHQSDIVLIEVREDFHREERTFVLNPSDSSEIPIAEHDLPPSILEAQDEIMIYINGVFTSFRNEIEYIKNKGKGSISLICQRYGELISYDPIFAYLEKNPSKKAEWEKREGIKIEEKIRNVFTLEWR